MFQAMMTATKEEFVRYMFHVQMVEPVQDQPAPVKATRETPPAMEAGPVDAASGTPPAPTVPTAGGVIQARAGQGHSIRGRRPRPGLRRVREGGPQRPLPCGSGRKYKKCHGAKSSRQISRVYWALKLPTGIGPGPVTEPGTSSTHVFPGVNGIWCRPRR